MSPMPNLSSPADTSAEGEALWVKTYPDAEGNRYHVELSLGEDVVLTLDPPTAIEWASVIAAATAAAEYDAAVIAQMRKLLSESIFDEAHVNSLIGQVITDIRADRPDRYILGDLELAPGVNADGVAFLILSIRGERVAQLTPTMAREHMVYVLNVAHVVTLDTTYLRVLRDLIGLEASQAGAMVEALAMFRSSDASEDSGEASL